MRRRQLSAVLGRICPSGFRFVRLSQAQGSVLLGGFRNLGELHIGHRAVHLES